MKLIHFSDLHLDSVFAWTADTRGAATRRRQALRDTLNNIVNLAVEQGADAVLCGGDLYEQDKFTPDTVAFLQSTFERLHPIRIFIAPGNHDWYGPQSLYRQATWTENVHVFDSSQFQAVELIDGLTLWGAAHRAPANTPGFLEEFEVDRGGVNVALFHGSERGWFSHEGGRKTLHAPFDSYQIESSGLHHAFLGHYHRPRDDPRFTYPGNPDPLTFGEDGERGAVVATVMNDGVVVRDRRSVSVTQVHDLDVDITGSISQQDVRDRVSDALASLSGFARVILSGEPPEDIDLRPRELSLVDYGLDSVLVEVGAVHVAYDLDLIREEPTVRGEFVREVSNQEIPEDEKRRILVTGLRALDGRDDLEVA